MFIKKYNLFIIFILTLSLGQSIFCSFLQAQPLLTQSFQFQSGVYLDYTDFQTNQPTYSGDAIKAAYFKNPQSGEIRVEYIRLLDTGQHLDLDNIWGISIKGIPYVQVYLNKPSQGLHIFAKMEVRGNICYYYYKDIEEKQIPFSAYNPLTGKPYRTAIISREIPVIKEKMLRFKSGVTLDFNYNNLINWIKEEEDLVSALKSLGPKEAEKTLFRTLLLYDDRNEVQLNE